MQAILQEPLLLCFVTIAIGMAIGSIRVAGLSLGTSGVLFAGLLLGHLGRDSEWRMPSSLGTLGVVLFVYAVGLGAGPTFFRAFHAHGRQLVLLSLITCTAGAITTWALSVWLSVPGDLAAGLLSGAMTSTPGLAAGIEAAQQLHTADPVAVSIGYGLAYPLGVVLTVLFVQLAPRFLARNVSDLAPTESRSAGGSGTAIQRFLVEISNPGVFGKSIQELPGMDNLKAQITRVVAGDRLVPIRADHRFESGQVVMIVADRDGADMLTLMLGHPSDARFAMDADHDRAEIVVTSPGVLNQTLRELHLRSKYGVTISRVERYGLSFVPTAATELAMADRIIAVGPPEGLKQFEAAAGHKARRLHETDLMSIGIGLAVGVALGNLAIPVPGLGSVQLGMAGGPLLSGLLFGHFGRFLGVIGYMPPAARLFSQELGLAFFLAAAGFASGGHFERMLREYGLTPVLIAGVTAGVSIAAAYLTARLLLKMNLLEVLGGVCGAMTSTAGVGAVLSTTDSDVPVSNYAAAYPAALVMMTILTQLIVSGVG